MCLTGCTKDKKHHSKNTEESEQEEVIDDIESDEEDNNQGGSGGSGTKPPVIDDDSDDINLEICGKISENPDEEEDEESDNKKANFKIINGYSCPSENSPVAKVYIIMNSNSFYCSGTLIDEQTILTAGHCFEGLTENVESIVVAFGTKKYIGKSYVVNPNNNVKDGIDTAVVKLTSKVSDISPVGIISSIKVNVGKKAIFYGYGKTETGEASTSLKAAYLKIYSVGETTVTTSYDESKASACFGDSGGPLIIMTPTGYAGILAVDSYGNLASTCSTGSIETFSLLSNKKNLDFIKGNSSVSTL